MKISEMKAALARGVTEFAHKPRKYGDTLVLVHVTSIDGNRVKITSRGGGATRLVSSLVLREDAEAVFAQRRAEKDAENARAEEADMLAGAIEMAIGDEDEIHQDEDDDGKGRMRLTLTQLRSLARVMIKAGLGDSMGLTKSEAESITSGSK